MHQILKDQHNIGDACALTRALVRIPSVTPNASTAIDLLQSWLEKMGFTCWRYVFEEPNHAPVDNLYARRGNSAPNLCFAGHLDVVPTGNDDAWEHNPWEGKIVDGYLFGRGCVDMKGSIGAWVSALNSLNLDKMCQQGSLSLLITADEEGEAINGTKKLLQAIDQKNERLDACITGEPTCLQQLGDTIKIGRRGSINFWLEVFGVQGHVGYPHLADNAAHKMVQMLFDIQHWKLDSGNDSFDPSSLSISTINIDNLANNVIPASAKAHFNIRFNDIHTGKKLEQEVRKKLDKICSQFTNQQTTTHYHLKTRISGESFLTKPNHLTTCLEDSIFHQTRIKPCLSTSGGTSDSRFIKNYCPVVDFGLIGTTMHQANEAVLVSELHQLSLIFEDFIKRFLLHQSN